MKKWMALLLALTLVLMGCQSPGVSVSRPGRVEEPPVVTRPALPEPGPDPVEELMGRMTSHEKILQLFIVTPQQRAAASEENRQVGGLIYFANDLRTREQTVKMIADAQAGSKIPLFISVDEEGGIVSRVGANPAMGVDHLPMMGTLTTTEQAYEAGATLGEQLKALGFNLDFAPVADVNSNPQNPVIGQRAFSTDPVQTAAMVAACVEGFVSRDMICTIKHFPGHGDTAEDSHDSLAISYKTLEQLRQCEFLPFVRGIDAGAQLVMVGHIALPNVTGDYTPASLSYEITTGLLREELGYDGVIVTDSMEMDAILLNYTPGQAALGALKAGADLILMPERLDDGVQGVYQGLESGELTWADIDERVERVLRLKYQQGLFH